METSQHVRGLINSWSKYGFTLLRYVVHGSGQRDLTSLHVKKYTSLDAFVCFCVCVCVCVLALVLNISVWGWEQLLSPLCPTCVLSIGNSSYLVFCWVLCHVGVLFLCYSMLFCFEGHGDLRTLNALLCVWPSFIEISHSLQKKKVAVLGVWNVCWLSFRSRKESLPEVVRTLMNNISGINIDGKNISTGNNLFLVIFSKFLLLHSIRIIPSGCSQHQELKQNCSCSWYKTTLCSKYTA